MTELIPFFSFFLFFGFTSRILWYFPASDLSTESSSNAELLTTTNPVLKAAEIFFRILSSFSNHSFTLKSKIFSILELLIFFCNNRSVFALDVKI